MTNLETEFEELTENWGVKPAPILFRELLEKGIKLDKPLPVNGPSGKLTITDCYEEMLALDLEADFDNAIRWIEELMDDESFHDRHVNFDVFIPNDAQVYLKTTNIFCKKYSIISPDESDPESYFANAASGEEYQRRERENDYQFCSELFYPEKPFKIIQIHDRWYHEYLSREDYEKDWGEDGQNDPWDMFFYNDLVFAFGAMALLHGAMLLDRKKLLRDHDAVQLTWCNPSEGYFIGNITKDRFTPYKELHREFSARN